MYKDWNSIFLRNIQSLFYLQFKKTFYNIGLHETSVKSLKGWMLFAQHKPQWISICYLYEKWWISSEKASISIEAMNNRWDVDWWQKQDRDNVTLRYMQKSGWTCYSAMPLQPAFSKDHHNEKKKHSCKAEDFHNRSSQPVSDYNDWNLTNPQYTKHASFQDGYRWK